MPPSVQTVTHIAPPFRPAFLLGAPHLQTLGAYGLRRPRAPRTIVRRRWETADGDFVDVDHLPAAPDAPHLLLFHGLEGSSRAGYVVESLRLAAARGWGALALNFRSCSGEPNRLWRSYHSGATEDVVFLVEQARALGIQGPLLGLGFSLGANVLLLSLAQTGTPSPFHAVAAISPPLDLQSAARHLDGATGIGAVYRHVFLRTLKAKAAEKLSRLGGGVVRPERLATARTIEAFDDCVTAPLNGFEGAADYYARCSSGRRLGEIRKPALLVFSEDDPLVPPPAPGVLEAVGNPNLLVQRSSRGGHVGFVGGSLWRPRFWAEEVATEFLSRTLR